MVLAALPGIVPLPSCPQAPPPGPDEVLRALLGPWSGRAVQTPVGPLPYDIRFLPTGPCAIAGAANPGAAVHDWTFYRERDRLNLRFLSTFRGNAEPLYLTGAVAADGTVTFESERPRDLRVRLEAGETSARISVAIRGEPHVEIRLTRPGADTGAPP